MYDLIEMIRSVAIFQPPITTILLAGTLLTLLISREWRLTLAMLFVTYFFCSLFFAEAVDGRIATAKLIVGLFVSLILAMTGVQLAQLPVEQAEEQPFQWPVRAILAVSAIASAWLLSELWAPAPVASIATASFWMLTFGGITLAVFLQRYWFSSIGLFLVLLAFELYYSSATATLGSSAVFAALHLGLALIVSLMLQSRIVGNINRVSI